MATVKVRLSEFVNRVNGQHERVTVTVHGRPAAVLLSVEDLESLEETLAVLSDTEAALGMTESEAEIARGEVVSAAELAELLREAVAFAAYALMTGPLLQGPHRVGKRLQPPLADRLSARRGTYRILCRVDESRRTVTVLDVARRRDINRPH